MKAKVKNTGEVIELSENKISLLDYARGMYRCETTGKKYHWKELEFLEEKPTKDIDWEQRRYEIAKGALQGFCANSITEQSTLNDLVGLSVEVADILIAELKKGGVE